MAKKTNQAPQQPALPKQPVKTAKNNAKAGKKMSQITKLCLLLGIIALLVYGNTLSNGYVLDDVMVLKDNTIVKKGITAIPEIFGTLRLHGYADMSNEYRPLSLAMFATEFSIWGLNPSVNHFFNILLFAGCVIQLFLFIYKLTGEKRVMVAFITALLFAVHPIHTEIVANIKSRDEILCFFFAFMSLNIFAKYMKSGDNKHLLLGTLALFLSFLSKETVVTFLAVIPFVFFFILNDDRKKAIFISGGSVVAMALFLGIRGALVHKYHPGVNFGINFMDNALVGAPNAASRLATEILIMGDYLKLLFIPYPLICDHSFNSIPFTTFGDPLVILSAVAYVAVAALAIRLFIKDRKNLFAFGIFFFLFTLSLFTNMFVVIASTFAERFLFFCSVGSCLIVALAIEKWLAGNDLEIGQIISNKKILVVLLPLCLIYAGITYARNQDWKDNYSLYKADVAKLPENTRLNYYIASELQKLYDAETNPAEQTRINNESITYLKKALSIYPKNTDAQAEIGAAYLRAKMIDSSEWHLKKALELNPKQSNASANLGTLYLNQNKFAEALVCYQRTTRLNFGNAVAQFNGGVCFYQLKQYDSAIQYFKNTIQVAPDFNNYKSFQFTAITYKTINQMDSAMKYESLAKEYDPKFKL